VFLGYGAGLESLQSALWLGPTPPKMSDAIATGVVFRKKCLAKKAFYTPRLLWRSELQM